VSCTRPVRPPPNGPDPRTASTVEAAVNRRPGERHSFVEILVRLDGHSLPDAPVSAGPTGAHGAGQGRAAPTERRATLRCAIAPTQ
jgi:hypothetical protein